jgi:hypothetical protein
MTAKEYIKSRHNGEIPYKYGVNECARLMELYADYRAKEIIEALTKVTDDLEACAMLMDEKGMSTEWIDKRIKECKAVLTNFEKN